MLRIKDWYLKRHNNILLKNLLLYYPKTIISANMYIQFNTVLTLYYNFKQLSSSISLLFLFLGSSSFYRFKSLVECTVVDCLYFKARFMIYYSLLSLALNRRLFLCYFFSEFEFLPSLSIHYNSANWLEREIYDLFGCWFVNHPDMRKLLTDYGFEGYPLRKDFPLTGFYEIYYEGSSKILVNTYLSLRRVQKGSKVVLPFKLFN